MKSSSFVNRDANHFPGYTRGKIAEALEDSEKLWLDEKEDRIDLTERLRDKVRSHNDIHWEVKAVEEQLEEEREGHRKLIIKWEAAREKLEGVLDATKYLQRDQKHLKLKVKHLSQERDRLTLIAKEKVDEEKKINEQLQEVRREWLGQEEAEQSFSRRQLHEAKEAYKAVQKKNREKEYMFDLERKRWEAKSLIEEQTMKRVKFEREQAQLEAYTTQQKLVEKRKQLEELLGEMERLDGELKESDGEIKALHGRIVALEQEKIEIKSSFEQERINDTRKMSKKTKQFSDKIRVLQNANQRLNDQLKIEETNREIWRQQTQSECFLKLSELKNELEEERDIYRNLTKDINEFRRSDLKPYLQLQEEFRTLQNLKQNLEDQVQDLRKKHEKETRQMSEQVEESVFAIEKIKSIQEVLVAEKKALEVDFKAKHGGDADTRFKIQFSEMEEENKQLLEESKRCKAENERFLADQQKSRSEAQAEQQKYFEKIVMIEQQRDVIKRQIMTVEKKISDAKHEQKSHLQEIDRLNEYPQLLKDYKTRSHQYEKAMDDFEYQANRQKTELQNKIQSLTKKVESLTEKYGISQQELESLRQSIEKVHDRETIVEDERRRIRIELDNVTRQISSTESTAQRFKEAISQVETQLDQEVTLLKRQFKGTVFPPISPVLDSFLSLFFDLRVIPS